MTMPDNSGFLRTMYLIRRFEETVLENFSKGVFFGTTHTYLGQEANAAGVLSHLQAGDIVVSNHRCHGHFLAYGGEARPLFAELMGKASGVCAGRGGSQHLHWRNFYSNGILGGMLPVATGMALAEKQRGNPAVVIAFLGDGTFGEGVAYESFNMAALWGAPILYVVEHNHIAQTTPSKMALAGNIPARFQAFDIASIELDSSDVLKIAEASSELLQLIRIKSTPQALILHTCRFGPHSKGDDTRPPEEIARLRAQRDPIEIHAPRLEASLRQTIYKSVDAEIAHAYQQALADPYPPPIEQYTHRGRRGSQTVP
jgi:acetoin:2,6-dichlorophenolindophenol oxidoreductase subunit alpha